MWLILASDLKNGPPYKYRGVQKENTVDMNLSVTVDGLEYLQQEDLWDISQIRRQINVDAPTIDLLRLFDLLISTRIRNAKINALEQNADDIPF